MSENAVLALENGRIFKGRSIGAAGATVGEVVFNTAMSGYQEILSDPSYSQQLVTLTYPHIGNVGCTDEDMESAKAHSAGLIIRDLPMRSSNWRAQTDLPTFLKAQNLVAIADIDTRALTRLLREEGAQRGCIMSESAGTTEQALEKARAFPGLKGADLAREVTTRDVYQWQEATWRHASNDAPLPVPAYKPLKVVAYDFGVKHNILRLLVDRACELTVVPATTPASEVLAMSPDGVFLSNGPGDPEPCDYAIAAIAELLENNIPLFGICLGHQLLGLACGARTEKMKFGHHGANHPVADVATNTVMITSQNHGFMIDEASLPDTLEVTHRSLFDGTVQGIRHRSLPAFSFQGHPEASPGPHDLRPLFDEFINLMQARRGH